MKTIYFQLGLLKILQCHRGESPDRRGSGGSGRSSSGSADSFQVSIHKFFIWEFYYICSALEFLSLFGALTTFLGSSLFLLDNHHQTAVCQPIQQCYIVLKNENSTVGLQDPEKVLEVFFNNH